MAFDIFNLKHFHSPLGRTNVFFVETYNGEWKNIKWHSKSIHVSFLWSPLHSLSMCVSEIESWKSNLDLGMGGLKPEIIYISNNTNLPALGSFYFIELISMHWQAQWCFILCWKLGTWTVIRVPRTEKTNYTECALKSTGSVGPQSLTCWIWIT